MGSCLGPFVSAKMMGADQHDCGSQSLSEVSSSQRSHSPSTPRVNMEQTALEEAPLLQ